MPRLGHTDLDVFPLCLGGNVFGWTADEREVHRDEDEGELSDRYGREGLACFPYFALAKGFLTGKYRRSRAVESVGAEGRAPIWTDARTDPRLRALVAQLEELLPMVTTALTAEETRRLDTVSRG